MSTGLILPAAFNQHATMFEKSVAKFRGLAPSHINHNQLCAAIMTELNGLPDKCTKGSVVVCVVNACVLGLVPGSALGHLHFIPFTFNRNKDNEYTVAQIVVGYKGFLELAYRNEFLIDVNPEVVLRNEQCERWHDVNGPQIRHILPEDRPEPTRENVVGAYCTWHTKNGGRGYYWRSRSEIDRVDRGDKSNTPWKTDYRGMVLKSAIRPAAKLWRLSGTRMAEAAYLDEQQERGEMQTPIVDVSPPEPDGSGDVRSSLSAVLNHKCDCKSDDDRSAVLRMMLDSPDVTWENVSPEGAEFALHKLMGWEKEHGEPLSSVLQAAKDR